jgi:hypothetical protein
MENNNLKKHGIAARMVHHPLATALGGILVAALCGYLGAVHGMTAALVMAALGAVIGAPMGATLAASSAGDA